MRITIDLEAVNGKQRSLLDFLKREEIQYEEEWDDETITSYNRELDEAEARIEAGEFTTQEQLEKEMASW